MFSAMIRISTFRSSGAAKTLLETVGYKHYVPLGLGSLI